MHDTKQAPQLEERIFGAWCEGTAARKSTSEKQSKINVFDCFSHFVAPE